MQHTPEQVLDRLARQARLAAGIAGICAVVVLVGWAGGLPVLTSLLPGFAATSVATAVGFLFCAAALWLRAGRRRGPAPQYRVATRRGAMAAAVIVTLTAGWLLAGYVLDRPDAGFLFGPDLGRVAPATAFCFLLLALGLLSIGSARFAYGVAVSAAGGLIICGQAIATYAYDAQSLYRIAAFAAMALPTAVLFTLLFIGSLLAQPFPGWMGYIVSRSSGGHMARRLLPAVILVPFLFGWVLRVIDTHSDAFDPAFGYALMAVVTSTLLTALVCIVSASLARTDLDLRRINDSLRDSERAARAITDTALDAFVQTDHDGRITEWNRQAESLFGWSRDEILDHVIEDVIMPPALQAEARQARIRYMTSGAETFLGRRVERQMLARGGGHLAVEMSVTVLLQMDGPRFNLFIRDLTEKNAIESQLRQAQKMEALGSLTGGLAHDFNNLLGVIVGNLDLLDERLAGHAEAREIAGDALAAALSGAELTRRLLAFARRQPLAPQVIDVNALVDGMSQMMKRLLGSQIEIETKPGAGIWPVAADPAQLESAILNLCTNARDAMPNGGRLTIVTENGYLDRDYTARHAEIEPGEYVVIAVTDTGSGMDRAVLDHVFEPFFTTKDQGKGTGLGLSMVFGFMKQSGGHVNVYSEPGIGTTFRLYLPRYGGAGAEPAAGLAAPAEIGGAETILVVEDDPDVRQVVIRQLNSLGYHTRATENTEDALRTLDSEAFDLLFTDIVMPGSQNGLDLAWIVRDRWPDMAVVLTSGFPEARARDQHDRLSGFPLLSKPYRKTELARVLRSALDTRRSTRPPTD